MGKVKQINNKAGKDAAVSSQKKITKQNTFGQYASNKMQKKDKKLVNKDLMMATLNAERKGNQFKDTRLIEKRKQMKEHSEGGRLATVLQKGIAQKKKRFDLDSDGENEDMPLRLTHKGKNLEDMDDFKERIEFSSEEDNIPAEIVDKLNFTGFEKAPQTGPDHKKSKKEVYEEIIKKSKKMKYERQQQKEEDKGKLTELNDGYSDIAQLLKFRNTYKGDDQAKTDEFDVLARQLNNEVRSQASTIIKKVEDKKQKKLQEKRRKQLKGIMSSDGEEEKDINNDDELASNTKRELGIMKHLRKVQNLNKFIDQIKDVKEQTKKSKGEEEEEDYDSLDEIDLDENSGDEDDEDQEGEEEQDEMEHLELEDEFESEDEKGNQDDGSESEDLESDEFENQSD